MFQQITERLTTRQRKVITAPSCKQAAVLVPLYHDIDQGLSIVFIQRTENTTHHRGQISFPGGAKQEEDQNLEATALRETAEEIGLHPEDVQLLGRLDDVQTKTSQFLITPIVGVIPPGYPYSLNCYEVSEIITSPLQTIALHQGDTGREYWVGQNRIWGATARILSHLLTLLE